MKVGIYRHYKGPLYLVLGLAHDANADTLGTDAVDDLGIPRVDPLGEREVVVYVPLMLDGAHFGPRMAVRTRADWEAVVCGESTCSRFGLLRLGQSNGGCPPSHGTPRFTYLGETYTPEMTP